MTMLVLGACARGGPGIADDGAAVDATVRRDSLEVFPDAPRPPDACIPAVTQLLQNPAYDLTPQGTGWIEQRIQAGYPLITGQDPVAEHSAPYKAWLGGLTGNDVTDVLYQDIAIPPATTQLVLAGYYDVRTDESSTASMTYDTGSLAVTRTDGTPIVTPLLLSNLTPKAAWTSFTHTFTQDLSGQTVRVRMTSTNDSSYVTSFYFDTFSLTATHGCP
ncbi:MAG TPA: hypothetical protein VN253_13795 [Kofleriaceae bacterium]|nr:hypothetical protein [Kofleriaceae bacterium]